MDHCFGFIGPGKMAGAIINGLLSTSFVDPHKIYIYGRSRERIAYFADKGCSVCDSLEELNERCRVIFLCIKPQNFPEIYEKLQPVVSNKNLYVSIAAGITFENLEENLGREVPFVRAMPNTPLLLGKGATALCRTSRVSDADYELVRSVFSLCGIVCDVAEDQINTVIAVSGSSPAYIYLFAKAVCDFAESQGFNREDAKKLFAQTLTGSAAMLTETKSTEEELIEMVSSKGGTTVAAMDALRSAEFERILQNAMTACVRRAEELAGK